MSNENQKETTDNYRNKYKEIFKKGKQ